MLPNRDQASRERALDVHLRTIADEHRLVRLDAAARERATENLGVGLAHALYGGEQRYVERGREAERLPKAG